MRYAFLSRRFGIIVCTSASVSQHKLCQTAFVSYENKHFSSTYRLFIWMENHK